MSSAGPRLASKVGHITRRQDRSICNSARLGTRKRSERRRVQKAEERAIAWAARENAYWARIDRERQEAERWELERRQPPMPRIY
jgi:hypothetical protein